ncbi:hypothetical protein HYX16_01540 [Candidatus Woesearchaeota archaeon]|nr:hypothetical protein [Candidatus Woesearchaeota archaeon]
MYSKNLSKLVLGALLGLNSCASQEHVQENGKTGAIQEIKEENLIEKYKVKFTGDFSEEEKQGIEGALRKIEEKLPYALSDLELVFQKKEFKGKILGEARSNRTLKQKFEDEGKYSKDYHKNIMKEMDEANAEINKAAEVYKKNKTEENQRKFLDAVKGSRKVVDKYFGPTEEDVILIKGKNDMDEMTKGAEGLLTYEQVVIHETSHLLTIESKTLESKLKSEFEKINEEVKEKGTGYVTAYSHYTETLKEKIKKTEELENRLKGINGKYKTIAGRNDAEAMEFFEKEILPELDKGLEGTAELRKFGKGYKECLELAGSPEEKQKIKSLYLGSFNSLLESEEILAGTKLMSLQIDLMSRIFASDVLEDIAETMTYWITGQTYADKDPFVKRKIEVLERELKEEYKAKK